MSQGATGKRLINPKVLRTCREQMALTVEEAQKKANLKTLGDIESGRREATMSQIDRLSEIYLVPSWVFAEKTLPAEHDFGRATRSFRTFKKSGGGAFDHRLRVLTRRVENLREEIISLKEDMDEPIQTFSPPRTTLTKDTIERASLQVRGWLNPENESMDFHGWRKALEDKGVFIFVTSPFSHWSKIKPEIFRGLSIHHDTLPIIIINGSDTYKANSFTLFHELGHLLMKKTTIDTIIGEARTGEERICDDFAENILMPANQMMEEVKTFKTTNKTSTGLRKLKRDMQREAQTQYGQIYSNAVAQAYFNDHITLHKARNMLGLKKAEYALKILNARAPAEENEPCR